MINHGVVCVGSPDDGQESWRENGRGIPRTFDVIITGMIPHALVSIRYSVGLEQKGAIVSFIGLTYVTNWLTSCL